MHTLTRSQFAKHINVKPGYITQLADAGRLVFIDNKIDVDASMAMIEATADPSKQGVAERHAEARSEEKEIKPKLGSVYQDAKARRELAKAEEAEINLAARKAELVPAADVKRSVANACQLFKNALESAPDILAPQLAGESNEQKVKSMLVDHIEQILAEIVRNFNQLIEKA